MKDEKIKELEEIKISDFQKELSCLLNKHSLENNSNTPDFILAEYLCGCLRTFGIAVQRRDVWYGPEVEELINN